MVVAIVVHVADVAGVRMGRRRRAVVAVHLLLVRTYVRSLDLLPYPLQSRRRWWGAAHTVIGTV